MTRRCRTSVRQGDLRIIEFLLAHGANPLVEGARGVETPLIVALRNSRYDIVRAMLISTKHELDVDSLCERRVDPVLSPRNSLSPLHAAIVFGLYESVKGMVQLTRHPTLMLNTASMNILPLDILFESHRQQQQLSRQPDREIILMASYLIIRGARRIFDPNLDVEPVITSYKLRQYLSDVTFLSATTLEYSETDMLEMKVDQILKFVLRNLQVVTARTDATTTATATVNASQAATLIPQEEAAHVLDVGAGIDIAVDVIEHSHAADAEAEVEVEAAMIEGYEDVLSDIRSMMFEQLQDVGRYSTDELKAVLKAKGYDLKKIKRPTKDADGIRQALLDALISHLKQMS